VDSVAGLLLFIPPILFALTFHEASHAFVATKLGDPTARLLGRLTLNPIVHLDPIGSILLLLPPHFGWARPVPVDSRYLPHPHRDMMWIALAGPVSNVILAALFGTLLRGMALSPYFSGETSSVATQALYLMVQYCVYINLVLAAFNMIPIFPLDGSRVVTGLLPAPAAERFRALEPIGPMLLLGIILLGSFTHVSVIGMLIGPIVGSLMHVFTGGILG
jgi:Zn-dependent protease